MFHLEAFPLAPLLVIIHVTPESSVLALIFRVRRTPIPFHAFLFPVKMKVGIRRQVIHQMNRKIQIHLGGIGVRQQFFQEIDVIDDHLVLLVQFVRSSRVLWVPSQHNLL
jgi:hypothetical protein